MKKSLLSLFYFPSKLWPKVVTMLSEHLMHLLLLMSLQYHFELVCKTSCNDEFNMVVTNMAFPFTK